MGKRRHTACTANEADGILRGELVARDIGWPARCEIFVEGIADAGSIPPLHKCARQMGAAHGTASQLAHPLPGDSKSLCTQLCHHLLSSALAGVAQRAQALLELWLLILQIVAKHVCLALLLSKIGID